MSGLLSDGLLDSFEPALILPEVKDPKNWWGGLIWVDNAKRYIYSSQAYQTENMWYNTEQVKPEEIRSFNDLLNPKWSGKIGYLDPRTPGSWYLDLVLPVEAQRRGVFKKAGGPKHVLSRDQRVLAESLRQGQARAGGRPHLLLFCSLSQGRTSREAASRSRDEVYISGGSGHVTILKGAPHPNATKVFINWFLGREGQEIFGKAMGQGTRRLDVDTQWLKEFGVIAAKDSLRRVNIRSSRISLRKSSQGARARGGVRAQTPRLKGKSMSDNYYQDLREFIEVLDHQGLLYRWQRLVDKDSELMPLMRLQFRGHSGCRSPGLSVRERH